MALTAKKLFEAVTRVLVAQKVPFIKGQPGAGKSEIVAQVAKEHNLFLIDVRLSQFDPTDINGFPTLENGRSNYCPPQIFPIEGDEIPDGYSGWLLFLDEINSAPLSVQAAAYKLILDRMIGDHKIHKNVAIVAAGNRAADKAIVNRMGTAMQSRLIHLNMDISHKDWTEWAHGAGIDHRVISFIEFRPELISRFNPNHSDDTFPCPRTWVFMSDIVKDKESFDEIDLEIAKGTVGEGAAIEFAGFMKIHNELPNIQQIMDKAATLTIPTDMSIKYAVTGLIAANVDESNINKLAKYVERLPTEFQLLTWRAAIRTNNIIKNTQYIKDWIKINAKEL